jgi:hypothetical protein
MDKRRREIVLGVLAVALIAVVFWRYGSTSSQSAVNGAANSSTSAGTVPGQKGSANEIDLQALKAERPAPQDSDRNPFRFKPKAPPPPPPGPMSKAGGADPAEAPGPIEPIGPLPPPPIPLKFIGLMSSKDDPKIGRLAVLTDGRGVYYGHEGDVIEGRYRILKIGVESIDLAYLDGRGRQTIRQTGQ